MLFDELEPYQQSAVDFCLNVKTAALFLEQGTGKTWVTLGVVEQLLTDTFSGLIIVPLTNIDSTWHSLIERKLPQVRLFREWDGYLKAPCPKLLLVHYEKLPSIIDRAKKRHWSLIVYDESQRLKSRGTRQSRNARMLRNQAPYKLILSGTPIERQPSDLWAQFRFLAPEVFGERWQEFEDQFLVPIEAEIEGRPGSLRYKRAVMMARIRAKKRPFDFDKLPLLLEMTAPYSLRLTKASLDLPELVVRKVKIELEPRQRQLYDALERDYVVSINARLGPGKSRVIAPLKVTLLTKLHQMTGGYVFDDNGDVKLVGRSKLRRTIELVRLSSKPVVVFCRYLAEVTAIVDRLSRKGYDVATLTGRTKRSHRGQMIEAFQRAQYDVLVCQIKTGGVGIDLFKSSNAIIYSTPYSFIDFEQALSRLHRRGQKKKVTIYWLIAENTVDTVIYKAISKKQDMNTRVLDEYMKEKHDGTSPEGRVQVRRSQPRR